MDPQKSTNQLTNSKRRLNIYKNLKRQDYTQGHILLSNLAIEGPDSLHGTKNVRGMRFANFTPEALIYGSGRKFMGRKDYALSSVSKRRTGPLFNSALGIFSTPSRDELIEQKKVLMARKLEEIERIKTQRTEYRITTKPARHADSSIGGKLLMRTERKPSEAELFKLVRNKPSKVKSKIPTFLEKFYQKNGIPGENSHKEERVNKLISVFSPFDQARTHLLHSFSPSGL